MDSTEHDVLSRLKQALKCSLPLRELVLFGSRARGDAVADSDMDVLVVLDGEISREHRNKVSDCVWEIGFDAGIIITPVVVSYEAWENGPEHESLLAMAIRMEGIEV